MEMKKIILALIFAFACTAILLVSTSPILAYHDSSPNSKKTKTPTPTPTNIGDDTRPVPAVLNATVSDCVTGARIKGATVFMPKTNGKPRKTTDGNGFVSISPVKPVESTHVVEVSAPGYQVFTYNIYFKARLTAFHSFCLRTLASQPTRTPTTVVEETQSGLQIIFAVKEKQFRNLAVSGKNQRGEYTSWKSSSDSYRFVEQTKDFFWMQPTTLNFEVEGTGARHCLVNNLVDNEEDDTAVYVIYDPARNACSASSSVVIDYDAEAEYLDEVMTYADIDKTLAGYILLVGGGKCSEAILTKDSGKILTICRDYEVRALRDYLQNVNRIE